jgi:hypothetical protein
VLEHSERDDAVVGAAGLAEVAGVDGETVGDAECLRAGRGVGGMIQTVGDAGAARSVVLRGEDKPAAVAAPDIEERVAGAEVEFLTNAVVFVFL